MNLNNEIKEIVYYSKGQEEKIDINTYNIEECFNNVSEQFTLLITNEEINKNKREERAIELIFKKNIKYLIQPINKRKAFNKAFIPLSGRYQQMLFLGNENGYGAYTPYGLVDCKLINIR